MTPYQQKQNLLFDDIESRFREGKNPSTIVGMRHDFENDPARTLTNVSFLPHLGSHPVYISLIQELRSISPTQYFNPVSSLHTTIKNVRGVSNPPHFTRDEIERIRPILRMIASRHAPFEITWQGLLLLPTSLALRGVSSDACTKLVQDLHQGLEQIGVPDDKFYASMEIFASTATLCRYTQAPSFAFEEVIAKYKNKYFGTHVLDRFDLVVGNSVLAKNSTEIIESFYLQR